MSNIHHVITRGRDAERYRRAAVEDWENAAVTCAESSTLPAKRQPQEGECRIQGLNVSNAR